MSEYFFVIALTYRDGSNVRMYSASGTTKAEPGQTRKDLFARICSDVRANLGLGDGDEAPVTFFSLEPNDLPGLEG